MKNKTRNSAYMKFANRQTILNIVRKSPVSRAELARITGLTRAAISIITDELITNGIINEIGEGEADYGRKPILLDINPNCYYAVGLYISRGVCTAGIVDVKGKPVETTYIDTKGITNVNETMEAIAAQVNNMISRSEIAVQKILGMGISFPGPLDIDKGIILNPPNFNMWHGVEIIREMKKHFPFKILLHNNSTSLALAEKNYGLGTQFNNFMLMVVDTGIGAGIIINDKLYGGRGGFGGEVGHTTIDFNGKRCSCGNRGCIELYASIPAVLRNAVNYDKSILSWEDIVDKAEEGDEFCLKIIKDEARCLSAGIINVMNILELEAVILTGTIRYKPDILLSNIRDMVRSSVITRGIYDVGIYTSTISRDAEIVSAASIIMDRFAEYLPLSC